MEFLFFLTRLLQREIKSTDFNLSEVDWKDENMGDVVSNKRWNVKMESNHSCPPGQWSNRGERRRTWRTTTTSTLEDRKEDRLHGRCGFGRTDSHQELSHLPKWAQRGERHWEACCKGGKSCHEHGWTNARDRLSDTCLPFSLMFSVQESVRAYF